MLGVGPVAIFGSLRGSEQSAMSYVPPTKFPDTVRDVFSYLQRYNFAETAADARRVTFVRDGWTIAVYFVDFENEVCLSVAYSGVRFEIYAFIEAADPEEFARSYALTAENDAELRPALESLSGRLKRFGARALNGDATVMDFVASAVKAADARRG
jgi:hypothetical protein